MSALVLNSRRTMSDWNDASVTGSASADVPSYSVNIIWDDAAFVWVAISDEIPLALESESADLLIERVKAAAPEILELNSKPYSPLRLHFKLERFVTSG